MLRSCVQKGVLALACITASFPAAAQEANDDALEAELIQLENEYAFAIGADAWDVTAEAEIAAGHRSNPLLAAFDRVGSDVLRANLNVFAWRLPLNGWEWTNLADATFSRYLAGEVEDASLVILRSESRWTLGDRAAVSVAGHWIHHDEVVDASTLDSGFGSVRARVRSPGVEVKYVRQLGDLWELSGELGAEYSDFARPLDDFNSYAGSLEARRSLGRLGVAGAGIAFSIRDYDSRVQSAAGGRPLDGTRLRIARPTLKLRHELRGGSDLSWRVRSHLGFKSSEDNGSGWYDYRQLLAGIAASLDGARWRTNLELGWSGSLYRVQTVGFGDPPRRTHDEWSMLMRCERGLRSAWSAFVEAEVQRSRSNDPFLNYDDTLVLAGLRWNR